MSSIKDIKVAKRTESAEPSIVKTLYAYDGQPGYLSMASGNPNVKTFPVKEVEKVAEEILDEAVKNPDKARELYAYGYVQGDTELIDALKDRYMKGKGIGDPERDELQVFAGAQQVLDLMTRSYCNEGDIVLVEDVTYGGALTAFWGYHAKTVGVPMDEDGIIPDELEKICQKYGDQIKFLYTIPTFQNPMGIEWSTERRKALYDIAVKYNFLILEDSPYWELRLEGEDKPTIKSFDKTGHVVFTSSTSKIMMPGLRIGFVIADKEVLFWLSRGKENQDMNNAQLTQKIVARYFREYDVDAHVQDNCNFYKGNREAMLKALDKYLKGKATWTHPNGGFFLWIYLPEGISGDTLAKYLLEEEKLIILPGSLYRPDGKDVNAVRLCYSVLAPDQIDEAISRFARGLSKMQEGK